jgi:ATP-binding cassette subfamily B protein IrtB
VVIVRYLEPFTELSDLAPTIESLRGTIRRTSGLLAAPVLAVPDVPAVIPLVDGAPPTIELRGVTFAHRAHDPDGVDGADDVSATLREVSFVAPAGATTAIVGPSGAGKTTILTLVARFADVDDGAVLVDGVPVDHLDPRDLLSLLGVVFQDVYLFDGTIRENVRHGRGDATDEELDVCARLARVDEIVARLPDGWETRVGEGGAALSGGERQRISIARALLKDAPVLLLDEATSAIDPENEAAILDALAVGDRRRTTLVVAHRLSTIERADQVVFVDDGRVVEIGSPRELLAAGGPFARAWADREASDGWTLVTD